LRTRKNHEFVSSDVLGSRRFCTIVETVCTCRGPSSSITQHLVGHRYQEMRSLCCGAVSDSCSGAIMRTHDPRLIIFLRQTSFNRFRAYQEWHNRYDLCVFNFTLRYECAFV